MTVSRENNPLMVFSIEKAFVHACLCELEALKPGNVHVFADGHGMVVNDFVKSAEAAAPYLCQPNGAVGPRVLGAMQVTWQAVSCNTNLGILLLCAPLLHAAERSERPFKRALQATLQSLTIDDAQATYQAIALANPAGLGDSAAHDVHAPPSITLLEAMQYAAPRDTIAKQYASDYALILDVLVPMYQRLKQRWERPAWATTGIYLYLLAHTVDTHIVRKQGEEIAQAIQEEMQPVYAQFIAADNPKTMLPMLLACDQSLKQRGINPGTSADLVVASLLAETLVSVYG